MKTKGKVPNTNTKEKKCNECKHHYLLWDWDNGHHSMCEKYDRAIPSPSRFDYPVKIPKWCEEEKHDKQAENIEQ